MEEPYRFRKKIVKIGNSRGFIIQGDWLVLANKKVGDVIYVEVYSDKIVLLPEKKKK